MDRTIKKTMQHLRPRHEPTQTMQLPKLPSVPLRTVWLRRDKNGDDMTTKRKFSWMAVVCFWLSGFVFGFGIGAVWVVFG